MQMKNILSINYLRTGAAWFCLILGIFLYISGYAWIDKASIWNSIVIKIADVLVIGVVLGFITNAAQFIGIFKQDLQDIIYGKEFIKQRKDIYPLWENISKELFKNKFPIIHKELLKAINDYLPKDEVSYYSDYEAHTTIEWINRDLGIIKLTDIISFDLISDTDKEIHYPIKTWTISNSTEQNYKNEITSITVNGLCADNQVNKKREFRDDDSICLEQELVLCGSTKYTIKYTRVKEYNIREDYYIGFRAKYIVKDLRVSLDIPDDLEATFVCRGTQKDFENINKTKKRIEKRYRGIVLPRQGYIFVLEEKKKEL